MTDLFLCLLQYEGRARLVREPLTSKNFQFSQGKIALLWDFLYIFAAELAI